MGLTWEWCPTHHTTTHAEGEAELACGCLFRPPAYFTNREGDA